MPGLLPGGFDHRGVFKDEAEGGTDCGGFGRATLLASGVNSGRRRSGSRTSGSASWWQAALRRGPPRQVAPRCCRPAGTASEPLPRGSTGSATPQSELRLAGSDGSPVGSSDWHRGPPPRQPLRESAAGPRQGQGAASGAARQGWTEAVGGFAHGLPGPVEPQRVHRRPAGACLPALRCTSVQRWHRQEASDARRCDGHGRVGSGASAPRPARDRASAVERLAGLPPAGGEVLRRRAAGWRRTVARETSGEPNFSFVVRLKGRWVRGRGSQPESIGEQARCPFPHGASAR
jgi:hypothetical protein